MIPSKAQLRATLVHPSWQAATGLPVLFMGFWEIVGLGPITLAGVTIGMAHTLAFLGAMLVTRGLALSLLPEPPKRVKPKIPVYAPLKTVPTRRALPPPLPDNIIPFSRPEGNDGGPELMA